MRWVAPRKRANKYVAELLNKYKHMKKILLSICIIGTYQFAFGQIKDPKATEVWEPIPRKVKTGDISTPPADAIVLFDGKNLDEWVSVKEGAAKWELKDNTMTVNGTGGIKTKKEFGDAQFHIEWRTPSEIKGKGQGRGNSGIFFQNTYELQILDSYESVTYSNGQAGSIYKQTMPLVNACKGRH